MPLPRRARAPKRAAALLALLAVAVLAACAGGGARQGSAGGAVVTPVAPGLHGYPFAAPRSTSQEFFGITVADDFAWLANADEPHARSWIAAEHAYSRRYLDAMPARAALRARLATLLESTSNDYTGLVERGGVLFALKTAPRLQRPVLVALKSLDDVGSERVVFDPNEAAPGGALAIEFFRPSPDGRKVAIALSSGDGGGAVVRVVDVATGQVLPGGVAHVTSAAAGGDLAWSAGGTGFFCTQVAASPAMQVVFHRLAGAGPDRVELGAALPRLARVRLESARDGRHVLALVEDGRGGEITLYVKPSDANGEGAWRRLAGAGDGDGVRDAQFGDDDALWVRAVGNAPRGKLLRIGLADGRPVAWDSRAAVAMPLDGAVQRFAVAGGTLYLAEGPTGPTRLRAIDLRTRRSTTIALPPGSAVAALARVGRNEVAAQLVSWLEPPSWSRVSGGRARRTALAATSDANFNDCDVVRESASSRDGTPVPVDILRPHGTRLDGRNPVLLMPGGSFGAGMTPAFDVVRRVWLDRGGVIAIATLRGASDAGEAWRVEGLRARRQNGVDDFIAAAELLVRRGYTQPALLAARGRGDGALVVAAALTQWPEQFRAVVAASGRYDLLRLQDDPAGRHDLLGLQDDLAGRYHPLRLHDDPAGRYDPLRLHDDPAGRHDLLGLRDDPAGRYELLGLHDDPVGRYDLPLFGSVRDRAQFDALHALSPLHAVRDGVRYPAVLLFAGGRDGGVDPAHSRKLTARLQQADPSGRVILLAADAYGGQPAQASLSGAIDQAANEFGFLLHEVLAAQ